jgi:hypothetical protein
MTGFLRTASEPSGSFSMVLSNCSKLGSVPSFDRFKIGIVRCDRLDVRDNDLVAVLATRSWCYVMS